MDPPSSSPPDVQYTCADCERVFGDSAEFHKHQSQHVLQHLEEQRGYSKQETVGTKTDLVQHDEMTHGEKHRRYWKCFYPGCRKPEKLWPRRDSFEAHIIRTHNASHAEAYIARAEAWWDEEHTSRDSKMFEEVAADVMSPADSAYFSAITRGRGDTNVSPFSFATTSASPAFSIRSAADPPHLHTLPHEKTSKDVSLFARPSSSSGLRDPTTNPGSTKVWTPQTLTMSPYYNNLSPRYNNLSPHYNNLSPHSSNLPFLYGSLSPHYSNLSPHNSNLPFSYSSLSPNYSNLSTYTGHSSLFAHSPMQGFHNPQQASVQIGSSLGRIKAAGDSKQLLPLAFWESENPNKETKVDKLISTHSRLAEQFDLNRTIYMFYGLCKDLVSNTTVGVTDNSHNKNRAPNQNQEGAKDYYRTQEQSFDKNDRKKRKFGGDNHGILDQSNSTATKSASKRRKLSQQVELACWWYKRDPIRYNACSTYCCRDRNFHDYRRRHLEDHWRWGDVYAEGISAETWDAAKRAKCTGSVTEPHEKDIAKWKSTYKILWGLPDTEETPEPACTNTSHLCYKPRRPICAKLPTSSSKRKPLDKSDPQIKDEPAHQVPSSNDIQPESFLALEPQSFFPEVSDEALIDPNQIEDFEYAWDERAAIAVDLGEQNPTPAILIALVQDHVSRIRNLFYSYFQDPRSVSSADVLNSLDFFEVMYTRAAQPVQCLTDFPPDPISSTIASLNMVARHASGEERNTSKSNSHPALQVAVQEPTPREEESVSDEVFCGRTSRSVTLNSPETPCSVTGVVEHAVKRRSPDSNSQAFDTSEKFDLLDVFSAAEETSLFNFPHLENGQALEYLGTEDIQFPEYFDLDVDSSSRERRQMF